MSDKSQGSLSSLVILYFYMELSSLCQLKKIFGGRDHITRTFVDMVLLRINSLRRSFSYGRCFWRNYSNFVKAVPSGNQPRKVTVMQAK